MTWRRLLRLVARRADYPLRCSVCRARIRRVTGWHPAHNGPVYVSIDGRYLCGPHPTHTPQPVGGFGDPAAAE